MYYSELLEQIKPGGRQIERSYVELQRYLVELTFFGLLKTNKSMGPEQKNNLAKIEGSDYFEINTAYKPQKAAPVYKTAMIAMVPPHAREALAAIAATVGDSDKEM